MTRSLKEVDAPPAQTRSDTRLWHPFAAMGEVRGNEVVITRGRDIWFWDDTGQR